MRAVAVLCVVVVHVAFFAAPGTVPAAGVLLHLNVGVTVFFLISGFLLYRPFIAHRAGGPAAPPIVAYARRRALRILPAYWLVLTVLTILPDANGVVGGDWLSQYALLHTIPLTERAGSCTTLIYDCGLAQTWSLVVELTFYAALPLWFLFGERLWQGRSLRGWVTIEIGALAVISMISGVLHFGSTSPTGSIVGATAIGYGYWFALGMALAVLSVAIAALPQRPRPIELIARHPGPIWLLAIAGYLGLCAYLDESAFVLQPGKELVSHIAFGVIAFMLLLPAVFGDTDGGAPRRFLANPAVTWIGLVSYGIFLWHYVVAQWLGNTPSESDFSPIGSGDTPLGFWPLLGATLAITSAIAALSYYALERPLLRFKR